MKRFALLLVFAVLAGCARFGYRDRVLHRVLSPDGTMLAVCQEIPEFDGPSYDVRLERQDGTVLRRLYVIGDGYPCDEVVWSSDGRTLAVVSSANANARFVDVAWAVAQPSEVQLRYDHWRLVSLAWGEPFRFADRLRFAGPQEIEYRVCPYTLEERRRTGEYRCTAPPETRRLRIPAELKFRPTGASDSSAPP